MKRTTIILSALFLFLSSEQLWSQEEIPYKPASIFNGDTLRYLEYNFNDARSDKYYKGKTVGKVLRDLEYPIISVVETASRSDDKLMSISLGVKQEGESPNPLKDYYIVIRFADPPSSSDFYTVYNRGSGFTPDVYNFLKDLKVVNVFSNPYIIMKREKLKMRKAQEENK